MHVAEYLVKNYGDRGDLHNSLYDRKAEFKFPGNCCVPIRTKRVRSQKSPWITADFKKVMHS